MLEEDSFSSISDFDEFWVNIEPDKKKTLRIVKRIKNFTEEVKFHLAYRKYARF